MFSVESQNLHVVYKDIAFEFQNNAFKTLPRQTQHMELKSKCFKQTDCRKTFLIRTYLLTDCDN